MADRSKALAVWAWVLYDFSNTIFSVSILTVFFPLWVEGEIGDGAWLVNAATAVAALLVLFTAPVLGPALTAVLLLAFGRGATAYRICIGSLAAIMALGIFFLFRVPDVRPDRTVDEFAPETLAGSTVDSSA